MPRFAANLSFLFTEVPFLDRFALAAAAGFSGVEFHFPYEQDKSALMAAARSAGLPVVLFNLPGGDVAAGELGIACLPGRSDEFKAGVDQALAYAETLGCRQINCLAGIAPTGADKTLLRRTLVENLRYAAERLGHHDVRLMLEPINRRDVPGFLVARSTEAAAIIEEVGAPNLMLQYDAYHMQIMEGDLAATLERLLTRIGHVQFADAPGRHEPGTGEINFRFLFAHLDRIGYRGWAGAEYRPSGATAASLGWLASATG